MEEIAQKSICTYFRKNNYIEQSCRLPSTHSDSTFLPKNYIILISRCWECCLECSLIEAEVQWAWSSRLSFWMRPTTFCLSMCRLNVHQLPDIPFGGKNQISNKRVVCGCLVGYLCYLCIFFTTSY